MRQRVSRIGGCGGTGGSRRGGPRTLGIAVGILVALLASVLVPSRTAFAQEPAPATAGGHLLLRGAQGDAGLAPVLEVDVTLRATGLIARGTVVQRFRNPHDAWVEATYVFPLPENAAVDGLRMRIGDRRIEGEIREREAARRLYERAREQGQRASLLEQQRPNAFTSHVANVAPHAEIEIEIDFLLTLRVEGSEFTLRLPWIVAPRYRPGDGAAADDRTLPRGPAAAGAQPDVALAIDLDPGFALDAIASPTHAIALEQIGLRRLLVTLEDGLVPADRDFVLRWRPVPDDAPRVALFREQHGGQDYLLLMLLPPDDDPDAPASAHAGREVIFVIDTSGSMGGPSIEQARAALRLAIERLGPTDRFNVIAFASQTRQLFAEPRFADAEPKARALAFVAGLEADGGTNMLPALHAALHDEGERGLRQIVFITDGCVGNEPALFAHIRGALGRSRLFTVSIGSAPNGAFMEGAARFGRGARVEIAAPEEVGHGMETLFAKLERPALTELAIHWHDRVEAWPARLPDLYHGEPLWVAARLDRSIGDVTLEGELAGAPWRATVPLAHPREALGIEKLFGRRKIAALMDGRIAGRDPETVKEEVVAVALEHGLVSRYTSLVAVERTPVRPRGEGLASTEVNAGLPAGFRLPQGATPAPLLGWLAAGFGALGILLARRNHAGGGR